MKNLEKTTKKSKKHYLALFLIGALYFFAFSPFHIFILAFAPIYLLHRIDKANTIKSAFWVGFVFFAGHQMLMVSWINNVAKFVGPQLHLGYILLVIILATAGGVIAALTKKSSIYFFPFITVAIEFSRQFGFWSFPWQLSGYIFSFSDVFSQSASIGGIFFLGLIFNFLIVLAYFNIKKGKLLYSKIFLSIIALMAIYGIVTLKTDFTKNAPKISAAVLQGSIRQDIKWEPFFKDSTYIIYSNLVDSVIAKTQPDIIAWPETAIPAWLNRSPNDLERVREIVIRSKAMNIVGSLRFEKVIDEEKALYEYYNSMYYMTSDGNIVGYYDKIYLVPFGEYMPFGGIIPLISQVQLGGSHFSRGTNRNYFEYGNAKIGTFICFEILFPFYTRELARRGANLLVTGSNDGWFEFIGPIQHNDMARFRSIETRRYMLRSANIGVSAIFDEKGRAVEEIGMFERKAVTADVHLIETNTLYYYIGDIFAYLSIVLSVFGLAFNKKIKKITGES